MIMAEAPKTSTISPLNTLFINLAKYLSEDDVNDIKHLLGREHVSKKDMDKLRSALDLFHHLEDRGDIDSNNLDLLVNLFEVMGKQRLRNEVWEFQREHSAKTDLAWKRQKRAAVFFMVFVAALSLYICILLGYGVRSVDQTIPDDFFQENKKCTRPKVGSGRSEDLPFSHFIPTCMSSNDHDDKSYLINIVPGVRDTAHVLPARFCLVVVGKSEKFPGVIYATRSTDELQTPKMGKFEYIESDVIQVFNWNNDAFRADLALGFEMDTNQTTRPYSIMTSDNGSIWNELPSTQVDNVVIATISNSGYFIVKSKPYQDQFRVDVRGCEYTCPLNRLSRISVPPKATLKPLVYYITIVYPNPTVVRTAFRHLGQDVEPALSPTIYLREKHGRKVQFRKEITITLPVINQLDKDDKQLKTLLIEDYLMDNKWRDVTNDVKLYVQGESVSFKTDHFSGYTYVALANASTNLYHNIKDISIAVDALQDYVERLWTGRYLAKLILLQNVLNKDNLLIDCVENESANARINYWKTQNYTKSDHDTLEFTHDIDIVNGQRINVNVNDDFESHELYKCGEITCTHKQKNHCRLQVKLLPGKLEKDFHTGSVTFSYSGSKIVTLRFVGKLTKEGSKDSKKEDTNNQKTMPVGQGHDNVNQDSNGKSSVTSGSVLILNDEWGTSKGGISTVHRHIARLSKYAGLKVYVTTLYKPSDEDKSDAENKGINIVTALEKGNLPLDLESINTHHATHFPDNILGEEINPNVVIGHIPITAEGALDIGKNRLAGRRVFQFAHTIPEDTDVFKEGASHKEIEDKEKYIMEVAKQSDVFFSVGPRIFNRYDGKFRGKNVVHMQYIPYPDEGFFDLKILPPEPHHPVRILTFGRVDEVGHLKGYDIIAEALSGVCELHNKMNMKCPLWDIVGIPDKKYGEAKAFIDKFKKSNFFDYKLHPYCTQQDIMDKLEESHLVIMPSRSEPFGMVGMEAIAAGVPVLITAHSGLAELMEKHFGLDGKEIIVNVGLDDTDREKDVEKWQMRVISMLDQTRMDERFQKAEQLKEELKSSPEIKKSHEDFVKMLRERVDIE